MGKAPRCSWDSPTDQPFACRVLPLPVVLFPEMPLRGRGGDKDGGMQLLPDNAVVWTSWPGTPSLFGCLQTRHWLPPEKVSPAAGHQPVCLPRLSTSMASLDPEKRILLGLPWHSALGRSNPTRGVETSLRYLGLPGQQGLWAEHWFGSQKTMFQSLALSPTVSPCPVISQGPSHF